jgi:putative transposase
MDVYRTTVAYPSCVEYQARSSGVSNLNVHLFVKAILDYSPAKLAREFKGYTFRILRQRHKHPITIMPTLWSRCYYVGSAGRVSDATISHYIEAQETRKR